VAAVHGGLGNIRAMGDGGDGETAAAEEERQRRWEEEKAALLVELGKLRAVRRHSRRVPPSTRSPVLAVGAAVVAADGCGSDELCCWR
jgi:hypothetical protein